MKAARSCAAPPAPSSLPALIDAAAGHADGFVRYRALVLLSGYDDPRVPDQMELAMGEVNDRLRVVGYAYFERHPEQRLIPVLLKAFDEERSELARPALTRALAAQGADAQSAGGAHQGRHRRRRSCFRDSGHRRDRRLQGDLRARGALRSGAARRADARDSRRGARQAAARRRDDALVNLQGSAPPGSSRSSRRRSASSTRSARPTASC